MPFNIGGEIRRCRTGIKIPAANIGSNLTGFTSTFQISGMASGIVDLFSDANGGDLIMTNSSGIRLPIATELINTGTYTGAIAALQTLSSSEDNYFDIYFDDMGAGASQPAAGAAFGSQAATSSNVKMRLTLDEDPSGAGYVLLDTTANANHGDPINFESGDSTTGVVNNALSGDGVNESVTIDNDDTIKFDYDENFTVTVAIKIPTGDQPDDDFSDNQIIGMWDQFTKPAWIVLEVWNQDGATPFSFRVFKYDLTNQPSLDSSTGGYNDGEWHVVTAWKSGSTIYLKVDDDTISSTTDTTTATTLSNSVLELFKTIQSGYLKAELDNVMIFDIGIGEDYHDAISMNILTPNTFYEYDNRVETFDQMINII